MMEADGILSCHGIRPTAVRLLIWREIQKQTDAFSATELEGKLPTVDRSTLFRALALFQEHQLLHIFDDGTGEHKYCRCMCRHDEGCCEDHSHEACHHVHATCVVCHRTFCLRQQHIPAVSLPEGFEAQEYNYVVRGICADCKRRRNHGGHPDYGSPA